MFKRYVQSKSLFFNRSYVVEHRKDVIKTVYLHPLGIFPTFLLRMNVSRYLLNVPRNGFYISCCSVVFLLLFENILKLIQVGIHEWADLYFFFYKNIFANSIYFWRPGVFRKKRKETHRFVFPYLYISLACKSLFGYFLPRPLSDVLESCSKTFPK